ncbi:hypothetical protein BgiBS90_013889 [Biomphalaria glabrata]|nr:hypothetical protein BgiBS90_013889 [Biomphalaria glabrata]
MLMESVLCFSHEEMEPVDLKKKKYIENDLVPTLDASIVRLAKIRKHQPPKCRNKAREITNNVIRYYSKVCVKSNNKLKGRQLILRNHQELFSTDSQNIPKDLNAFMKVITETLAQRQVIKEVLQSVNSLDTVNKYKKFNFGDMNSSTLPFLSISLLQESSCDFHLSDNPDFVCTLNPDFVCT